MLRAVSRYPNPNMTMKPAKESQERVSGLVSDLHKPMTLDIHNLTGEKIPKVDRKVDGTEESHKWRKKPKYVHSQILRIREEDSHLGQDFGLGAKDSGHLYRHDLHSEMEVVLFSRPILSSSPLSGKTTTVKALF